MTKIKELKNKISIRSDRYQICVLVLALFADTERQPDAVSVPPDRRQRRRSGGTETNIKVLITSIAVIYLSACPVLYEK